MSFDLKLRLKDREKQGTEWDENFIRSEILKFETSEIERIWVCGPPKMNEMFDKSFGKLIDDGTLPLERF